MEYLKSHVRQLLADKGYDDLITVNTARRSGVNCAVWIRPRNAVSPNTQLIPGGKLHTRGESTLLDKTSSILDALERKIELHAAKMNLQPLV